MLNAVRHPGSKTFSRGFLIVTPGITIRDRLRVLLPNDPDSYYRHGELVPADMLPDVDKAKIVIANYHAFKLRERVQISKVGRALLKGRGPELSTLETEGQMLQRIMPELMSIKGVVVLNDEAHHCYRERVEAGGEEDLKGEEKDEAKKNNEAARLWISGIEIAKRKLGLSAVYDLSATPFFLRGSGYAEGTLFPWTVSDFSLMDAIESGIVKLPRVPVADNLPTGDMPIYRSLWDHIGKRMPKKGRGKGGVLDPLSLPAELQTALSALYGHYEKTLALWQEEQISVPPVFILVCNNTATSKLVYDFISGFEWEQEGEESRYVPGRLELFRNFDEYGNRLPRPRTLLIDSEQLESGEAHCGACRRHRLPAPRALLPHQAECGFACPGRERAGRRSQGAWRGAFQSALSAGGVADGGRRMAAEELGGLSRRLAPGPQDAGRRQAARGALGRVRARPRASACPQEHDLGRHPGPRVSTAAAGVRVLA